MVCKHLQLSFYDITTTLIHLLLYFFLKKFNVYYANQIVEYWKPVFSKKPNIFLSLKRVDQLHQINY